MNQYARVCNGKTIHSCVQLEAYKHSVDDKSIAVGGKQRIITPDGYAIPLHVRDGLVYMDMQPYTNEQFDTLPHIIMTSDLPWDPTVFDGSNDNEEWFDAVSDLEHIADDAPFDEYGEYRHTHELEAMRAELSQSNNIDKYFINSVETLIDVNERTVNQRQVDCDKYRARFGYIPQHHAVLSKRTTKPFAQTIQISLPSM